MFYEVKCNALKRMRDGLCPARVLEGGKKFCDAGTLHRFLLPPVSVAGLSNVAMKAR